MDAEREKQVDEALARMRAAFADVPEEQLMQDVAEIIERDRQEQRPNDSASMRVAQAAANGRIVANPTTTTSRERIQAIIRQMAVKHRQSLETLAAYDRGEIERPEVGRSAGD